jgi:DNA repair protein RecO (recombination protein O)
MRSYKVETIVIKRRNFGESDRILSVLTKYHGKIQIKAPGVRKITSRRSSHIELLNLSLLTLYRSHYSSMPIVTEAEVIEEFLPIKKMLSKIGLAYYICELVDSLCAQNQENRNAFFITRETLFKLNSYSLHNYEVIEDFEDKLLTALGFLPIKHNIVDRRSFIESILEKKLRTRRLLPLFLNHGKG